MAETSCNELLLIEVCNVPVEQEALKKAVHCGLSDCSLGYSKQEVNVCVRACVCAPGNKGNSTTVLVKIEFTRYHRSVVPIHCIHMLQRVGVLLLCD